MPDTKENEKVWISCRAKEGCPSTYAKIIMIRNQNPTPGMGQFNITAGGKIVRYQCCTCNGIFTVVT